MNYTPIVNAIIALIGAIFTVVVAPALRAWLNTKRAEIDEKLSADEQKAIHNILVTFVKAAQQMAEAEGWNGEAKLAFVTRKAKEIGIDINDPTFRTSVEALVFDIKSAVIE